MKKTITPPRVLRFFSWLLFIIILSMTIISFISIFNVKLASALNSTQILNICFSIIFFIFTIIVILIIIYAYRAKIVATKTGFQLYYTLKKSRSIDYVDVGKIVFEDSNYRGMSSILIYDSEFRKIAKIGDDRPNILLFIEFLEENKIDYIKQANKIKGRKK